MRLFLRESWRENSLVDVVFYSSVAKERAGAGCRKFLVFRLRIFSFFKVHGNNGSRVCLVIDIPTSEPALLYMSPAIGNTSSESRLPRTIAEGELVLLCTIITIPTEYNIVTKVTDQLPKVPPISNRSIELHVTQPHFRDLFTAFIQFYFIFYMLVYFTGFSPFL